ncbi:MbcA/ParS/Xre antitoxin family protein [Desulfuromonas acetoxidans]|uniref:MbcA/ParS/Xre antitoxin family protein n=1 Tax=Desulfuromonas acetoxidans TaxID=891 RepID=UPI0005908383|nr:MbcA/ParS/Xre antitoxin family protein [Desulfuromonas acetoxidans]
MNKKPFARMHPDCFEPAFNKAIEVFGDEKTALAWLQRESTALGGKAPWSLLDTASGRKQVCDELDRIEHGIVS